VISGRSRRRCSISIDVFCMVAVRIKDGENALCILSLVVSKMGSKNDRLRGDWRGRLGERMLLFWWRIVVAEKRRDIETSGGHWSER